MKIFDDFLKENVNSDKFKKTKTIPISGNKDIGDNDLKSHSIKLVEYL